MKSLARSYFWWPGLDSQIEEVCRTCVECCAVSRNPPKAPAHPWMIPQHPWQRVHVDHAHFGRHLLLVAVDAYSKWPEVHIVSSTSAQQTIDKLRSIFACHGLPAILISDNGSPFQSTEFQQFVTTNGIVHRRVPPYHPSSNELAENMVKIVKHTLAKAKVTKDAHLGYTHCTFPGHVLQHSAYHSISNTSRASPQPCTMDSPVLRTSVYVTAFGTSC